MMSGGLHSIAQRCSSPVDADEPSISHERLIVDQEVGSSSLPPSKSLPTNNPASSLDACQAIESKWCPSCKKNRPVSDFASNKTAKDGLQSTCRECHATYHKQWYARKRKERISEVRGWQAEHRAAVNVHQKTYSERHKEKVRAKTKLNTAKMSGEVVAPGCCEVCGNKARLHAHHYDYAKQTEVIWLCQPCHEIVHAYQREVAKRERPHLTRGTKQSQERSGWPGNPAAQTNHGGNRANFPNIYRGTVRKM